MFGGVDGAFDAQNCLRARDVRVVNPLMTEVSESGTVSGSGQCGYPRAAVAAVQIHTQPRTPLAHCADGGRQDVVQIGIVFEERPEAVFYYHREPQVRPRASQNVERGSRQNAVAQGSEPNDGDAAAVR